MNVLLIFKTDGELRRTVRDALICITSAFILNKEDESNIALMNALLSVHIESPESSVRYVLNAKLLHRLYLHYINFSKSSKFSVFNYMFVTMLSLQTDLWQCITLQLYFRLMTLHLGISYC